MGKIPDTAAARKALKVAEIKALLEEAGLATDGTKPTLVSRLTDHLKARARGRATQPARAAARRVEARTAHGTGLAHRGRRRGRRAP